MSSWYHSPYFQDLRVLECPVHRTSLRDRCRWCGRFIDPIAVQPWNCPECRHPLALAPTDWRRSFKSECGRVDRPEAASPRWGRSDDGASVWVGQDHPAGFEADDSYARDMHVYEDLCSLWDSLAERHRHCAQHEDAADMEQYAGFGFRCPLAAAFLQAGQALGIEAEPRGKWPSFRRPYRIWAPDRDCPAWAIGRVTREHLRSVLLSALETLSSAAERGWSEALWQPEDAQTVKTVVTSRGLLLPEVASESELLKACHRAAEGCPQARR